MAIPDKYKETPDKYKETLQVVYDWCKLIAENKNDLNFIFNKFILSEFKRDDLPDSLSDDVHKLIMFFTAGHRTMHLYEDDVLLMNTYEERSRTLERILNAGYSDICSADGSFVPLNQMPKTWQFMIKRVAVDGNGNIKSLELVDKIKLIDKLISE